MDSIISWTCILRFLAFTIASTLYLKNSIGKHDNYMLYNEVITFIYGVIAVHTVVTFASATRNAAEITTSVKISRLCLKRLKNHLNSS